MSLIPTALHANKVITYSMTLAFNVWKVLKNVGLLIIILILRIAVGWIVEVILTIISFVINAN